MNRQVYPIEVVTTLNDLMRFEYMVEAGNILPKHPIYSLLAGRHDAKVRGRGLDFEEVRVYTPGDDIRNIDWKVTARAQDTYSKVFNEEKERPTFTVVDQSSLMFFGSQRYVKSVIAAQLAALSGFYTIKRGDRFGGLIFNEEGHDYVSPKRSKALVQHFLQLLVNRNQVLPLQKQIKPQPGLLSEMLQRTRETITHDYVLTVITDILTFDDESKHHLRSMAFHNDIILVHIQDPMDQMLPEGRIVLGDGEKQIAWNNKKNKWGEKYTIDYHKRLSGLIEEFRHYKIPVSIISTDIPLEEQIKKSNKINF